jgi:hypothetical protein
VSTDHATRLQELGDALEQAAARDLANRPPRTTAPGRRRSPRLAVALAAVAVAVPAAALAATQLLSDSQVASSIPAGTLALVGTHPRCTVVRPGVEYRCTLAKSPSEIGGPAPGQWQGTVEPTVDATKHVNGGCRSLDAAGTRWECYIGRAAVSQSIIGPHFLGAYAPSPGVG